MQHHTDGATKKQKETQDIQVGKEEVNSHYNTMNKHVKGCIPYVIRVNSGKQTQDKHENLIFAYEKQKF